MSAAQDPPLPAAPRPHPKPRIWPAIVIAVAAPVAALVAVGVTLIVVMLLDAGPALLMDAAAVKQWMLEFGSTPAGLALMVIPGQIVMFIAAIGAAALSSRPLRRRLAIGCSALPWWSWPFLMLGTLAAGMIGAMLTALLPETDSDQLTMIYTALAGASGWQLIMMLLVISVTPGIVEEFFFRGYVQSRLLRRWPPVLAIGFSTIVFALAHGHPIHAVAVLPIGAWLGIIAWRAGSIIPAIICHAFNNAVALFTAGLATEETIDSVAELPIWILALCGIAMIVSIAIMAARRSAP